MNQASCDSGVDEEFVLNFEPVVHESFGMIQKEVATAEIAINSPDHFIGVETDMMRVTLGTDDICMVYGGNFTHGYVKHYFHPKYKCISHHNDNCTYHINNIILNLKFSHENYYDHKACHPTYNILF